MPILGIGAALDKAQFLKAVDEANALCECQLLSHGNPEPVGAAS
jgi:hypothetical protein